MWRAAFQNCGQGGVHNVEGQDAPSVTPQSTECGMAEGQTPCEVRMAVDAKVQSLIIYDTENGSTVSSTSGIRYSFELDGQIRVLDQDATSSTHQGCLTQDKAQEFTTLMKSLKLCEAKALPSGLACSPGGLPPYGALRVLGTDIRLGIIGCGAG
ncbi:MAG: hypothetical protein ACLGGX_05660 [Bdellovibrionia bacterium]